MKCPKANRRYDELVSHDQLHLPVIPHSKAGVKCSGSIVADPDGAQVTLRCNECGAVVGTINAKILNAWEQAITDRIVIHKFDEADAPEVLTSISEECQRNECQQCPGTFHREDAGDETIFCVHFCHQVERGPGMPAGAAKHAVN